MEFTELLHILASPKCHGDLTLAGTPEKAEGFSCANCQLLFPIRDDIPVLLLSEALDLNVDAKPNEDNSCAS